MNPRALAVAANRLRFPGWRWLARAYDRYLQRRDLGELDDWLLRDIGLRPQDVERECAKPFWRP